jgi:hypothetical protein
MQTKKKPTKRTPTTRKRSVKRKAEPRPYVVPKMAAEYGITCLSDVNGKVCGKAVVWFDYELGERQFYKGFVCDDHRISSRVEKLEG